jgi:hypothetical protein
LIRLTKLHGNESIHCSRCEHVASVLLFNGSKVASASQLMFFCRDDFSSYLRDHPGVIEQLLEDLGFDEVHLMLD